MLTAVDVQFAVLMNLLPCRSTVCSDEQQACCSYSLSFGRCEPRLVSSIASSCRLNSSCILLSSDSGRLKKCNPNERRPAVAVQQEVADRFQYPSSLDGRRQYRQVDPAGKPVERWLQLCRPALHIGPPRRCIAQLNRVLSGP